MNALAWTYLAYLVVSVGITIWVARTLRRHGVIFLTKREGEQPLAEALTHLLVVGFYLVNFGVISFVLKASAAVSDVQTGIELASTKIGTILVIMGAMHFVILMVFSGSRRDEPHRDANLRHHGGLHPLEGRTLGSH